MPFDNSTRNRLQRFVSDAKKLLNDEFKSQLQTIYGIQPNGEITNRDEMHHLDEDQYFTAELLRERINHLESGITGERKPKAIAVESLIREQSFTILNRFAAMRMCEERGIIQESVANGFNSKGFRVYQQTAGASLGDTYNKFKTFTFCLWDELSVDLGILFDRLSPFGLLFPKEKCLEEFFIILNERDITTLWKEDETIGWIYQYFNSKEEREEMRRASQSPRNSRELAIRNQFFTPRYVVQFLTDNTLGRIWYEMTQGKTSLVESCDYFVKRPNEIFLKENEKAPKIESTDINKTKEELINEPVYIEYRSLKDPREITMLDPACGSMHFGLYAFDLFEKIYEEAWDSFPELLNDIREKVKTKEGFLRLIPGLIIRHNIHGIDIDPRAVQIANLSLWLRAQKYWQQKNIKTKIRPQIKKSNVVCAEPMPGEINLLEEFIKTLQPSILGDMVKEIWEKMQLAGEAGSLLKIEEEIKEAVDKAREEWKLFKDIKGVQMNIFQEGQPYKQEMFEFELSKVEAVFWDNAEDKIVESLKTFAEGSTNGDSYQRNLFANDAIRGFSFIDLSKKKFDIMLMNPPFGDSTRDSKVYIKYRYGDFDSDLGMCFVSRHAERMKTNGLLGAITTRVFIFNNSLEDWRKFYCLGEKSLVKILADLGYNVLDNAMVEVAAYTLTNSIKDRNESFFIRLLDDIDKESALIRNLNSQSENIIKKNPREFFELPSSIIAYQIPEKFIQNFKS